MSYTDSHTGEGRGRVYDALYEKRRERLLWECVERPVLLELFQRLHDEGVRSVLDFACGTGRITCELEKVFDDVVGVDVSPDMLEVARGKCRKARLVEANLLEHSEVVEGVDLITAFRFFPNAEESLRRKAISALAGRLSRGGLFVANNHFNAGSLMGRVAGRLRRRSSHFVPATQLERLFREHGLSIQRRIGTHYIPVWRDFDLLPAGLRARLERRLVQEGEGADHAGNVIYVCRFEQRDG